MGYILRGIDVTRRRTRMTEDRWTFAEGMADCLGGMRVSIYSDAVDAWTQSGKATQGK